MLTSGPHKRRITVGTVAVGDEGRRLVLDALSRGRISSGKYVREFEDTFAAYHGVRYGVAVSSGTDADAISFAALRDKGAQQGDEVIVPALAFVSVANAVVHAGLTPRFADVDPRTYNLTAETVEKAITPRSRALCVVHNFGRPAPMAELLAVAERYKLTVIEDAAEAHGARYRGRLVGTFGEMATFSFYVAHILTTGEGGMVITDDGGWADLCRSLRAHGRACSCPVCVMNVDSSHCPSRYKYGADADARFYFERIGFSSKMNELEAALGLEQVSLMDDIVRRRRQVLARYNQLLSPFGEWLQLFEDGPDEAISPLCYPIVIREGVPIARRDLTLFLEGNGVETRPAFGCIPTQQPAYAFMGHRRGDFPGAEFVGANGFYIGCHQNLTDNDVVRVASLIGDFVRGRV